MNEKNRIILGVLFVFFGLLFFFSFMHYVHWMSTQDEERNQKLILEMADRGYEMCVENKCIIWKKVKTEENSQ